MFLQTPPHLTYPSVDIEVYSEAGYIWNSAKRKWRVAKKGAKSGLACVGGWNYARHPSTELLCLGFNMHRGMGYQIWRPNYYEDDLSELYDYVRGGGIIKAWHSFFEYLIWNFVMVPQLGAPPLLLSQTFDTAALARAASLPGGLGEAAAILRVSAQKDKAGTAIMRKVTKPRDPTKKNHPKRWTPEQNPEEFKILYEYCLDDVRAEDACGRVLPELGRFETEVWQLDQRINLRGVQCDHKAVKGACRIIEAADAKYLIELRTVTGGAVQTVGQTERLKKWMGTCGISMPNVQEATVDRMLADSALTGAPRRALELRQILGLSSVKKALAMKLLMDPDDHRLREQFIYSGAARTRRFAGSEVQPQNLYTGGPIPVRCDTCGQIRGTPLGFCPACFALEGSPAEWGAEAAEACLPYVTHGELGTLEAVWGDPLTAVAGCLRGMFTSGPGLDLTCLDFSAIEAVMLAFLANEPWRMEIFRTHGKIYEATASRITGRPIEEIKGDFRKKWGKIPELASGYAGGIGAWKRAGAGEYMSDDEIHTAINQWRADSPQILKLWGMLQANALAAMREPDMLHTYRGVSYVKPSDEDVLYCWLPSGHAIPYREPRLGENKWGNIGISFGAWKKNGGGWIRQDLSRSVSIENVIQTLARDRQCWSMLMLDKHGYDIVLHVHDEDAVEGHAEVSRIKELMEINPVWCHDWPIRANGWRGHRYRKDE